MQMEDIFYKHDIIQVVNEQNVDYNPQDKNIIDICIINNLFPNHLREHLRINLKHIKCPFYYNVFNIYYSEEDSEEIRNICKEFNVSLIEFKIENRFDYHVQIRIGNKLNYIYNDYVKKRGCKYYGMFHQDSYLVEDIDFIKQLDEYPCFGRVFYGNRNEEFEFENIREKNLWYLWEGFCFLKTEYFPNYTWMPNYPYSYCYEKTYKWGATGVLAYYDNLYKFDENKCNFETLGYAKNKRERINIRKTDMDLSNIIHPDWGKCVCEEIDHFGCFIHGNGTAYMRMELKEEIDKKQDIILSFLQTL